VEAGKKRLAGNTGREASCNDLKGLRIESLGLIELMVENSGAPCRRRAFVNRGDDQANCVRDFSASEH
jgi:hypothetical protein